MGVIESLLKYRYVIDKLLKDGHKLTTLKFIKDITRLDLRVSKSIMDNWDVLRDFMINVIDYPIE